MAVRKGKQMITDEQLTLLKKYMKESNNIVFFGGAGVSTESGIPDFRSKDGLYNNMGIDFSKYKPEYLLSFACLYHEPEVFFEFYKQNLACNTILSINSRIEDSKNEEEALSWLRVAEFKIEKKYGVKNVLIISYQYIGIEKGE